MAKHSLTRLIELLTTVVRDNKAYNSFDSLIFKVEGDSKFYHATQVKPAVRNGHKVFTVALEDCKCHKDERGVIRDYSSGEFGPRG